VKPRIGVSPCNRSDHSLRNIAYTEELNMVEDVVIVGEVIAGNNIDTRLFLDLPMRKTKTLALSEKVTLGQLSGPVGFCCFLEVSVHSHARKTENGTGMVSKAL